jgi:two-component system, cell cycle sensor histidine kinase and response regulator CckA
MPQPDCRELDTLTSAPILRVARFKSLKYTVLLVDDDPEVCRLLERMLGHLGFQVLSAQDGPEALALLAGHQEPVHVLVTDLQMPGMDGRELAGRFAELRPGAGVLFLSGCADQGDDSQGGGLVAARFLLKPFTSKALSAEIHALIGDTPVN